jgi:MoaA/NifB/PqqE/SkfB family radical SAM enzyme
VAGDHRALPARLRALLRQQRPERHPRDHGHGRLERTIDQAVDLGVARIQLIGGEPTLHPDLPALVRHALRRGSEIEVYSNLVRVSDELWRLFESPGVALATSYYSPAAEQHDAVTGRRSHDRTLASIRQALVRDVPGPSGLPVGRLPACAMPGQRG